VSEEDGDLLDCVPAEWPLEVDLKLGRSKRRKRDTRSLTVVMVSDTHTNHSFAVPDGDLLLHAGDFAKWNSSLSDVQAFNAWLGTLPHAVKIVTAGNHDRFPADQLKATLTNATFLCNESVVIWLHPDGVVSLVAGNNCRPIKVCAVPQTPARSFVYRANGFAASLAERMRLCAAIDDDVDFLLTHAPPHGVLDQVGDTHEGCVAIRRRVAELPALSLHCFGHCHNWGGHAVRCRRRGTTFVNAAQAFAEPVVAKVNLM
jgi:Icc-related predicted phosphoesterase